MFLNKHKKTLRIPSELESYDEIRTPENNSVVLIRVTTLESVTAEDTQDFSLKKHLKLQSTISFLTSLFTEWTKLLMAVAVFLVAEDSQ